MDGNTMTQLIRAGGAAPRSERARRAPLREGAARAEPYDPDNDVTASEPFDVMEFIRLIHRERDASRRRAQAPARRAFRARRRL